MTKRMRWATVVLPKVPAPGHTVPVRFLDREWNGTVTDIEHGAFAVVWWGGLPCSNVEWHRAFYIPEGGGESRYGIWMTDEEVKDALAAVQARLL